MSKFLMMTGTSVIVLVALATPASAQDLSTPASTAADVARSDSGTTTDIIVTAQKRSERLQDVPMAISAVGGASLQTRNLANLSDFAVSVPSVHVQTRRGVGIVTIRGIGFDIANAGADPGVAIHSDGVYISRPFAALAGFYDLERVEIARGPQGTLYGRNATGGAVNLITRAPTAEPEGVELH
jgi:iron complex outermembrane receptor protein